MTRISILIAALTLSACTPNPDFIKAQHRQQDAITNYHARHGTLNNQFYDRPVTCIALGRNMMSCQ